MCQKKLLRVFVLAVLFISPSEAVAQSSNSNASPPAPDYHFEAADALEYFHFQSRVFNCNMLGPESTLAYSTNNWFAVEGDFFGVFSPNTVSGPDHGKLAAAVGGFRVGGRRAKWEPWGHGLFGWSHLQPQTAAGGRNTFMTIAGGGLDYRINEQLSLRGEADYVNTHYFGQSQSNFQIVGGMVMHF